MEAANIAELKQFVEHCKSNPSVLHDPSLSFFKNYIQSLGTRIPAEEMVDDKNVKEDSMKGEDYKEEDEVIESDIELDDTDVVEPDTEPPQKMGDLSAEVTEENQEAAQVLKAKAVEAIAEGKLNEAIDDLTDAIVLNPSSAILFATRAGVFVRLKKPNAAICDADTALQINPDSAKGYKIRGMARAMLGLWTEAASDLHVASRIDYDEEIGSMLKKVEPNAQKIEVHRRKYERLRKQREQTKLELERKWRQAEEESKVASALKDAGQVIGVHSSHELESKLSAASQTSRLSLLYFTATWCGPCRFISPLYANLAEKYPKVVFLKADIDEASEVAAKWKINSVPTIFFIKNGKEIDKIVGADKSTLEKKIAQYAG